MILRQFPNLQWLKAQAAARFSDRRGVGGIRLEDDGWPSVVMHVTVKDVVRDNIQGPFSIFTNLAGTSDITVDGRRVTVTPENFFISNSGQHYTLELSPKASTETFNIHFGEHFAKDALSGIFATPAQALENRSFTRTGSFGFHNRVAPMQDDFRAILESIRASGTNKLFLEEKLYQLLVLLLVEEGNVAVMRERLTSLKSSTREEILKRLLVTTDYLNSYYHMNPDLDELARIGCMSKFHFLRLFKLAFQQTPHQFTTSLKIKRAKELLLRTNMEIHTIANHLGFDASSTFSRLFHEKLGVYPSQFRTAAT